jgi:hypothetical protein
MQPKKEKEKEMQLGVSERVMFAVTPAASRVGLA